MLQCSAPCEAKLKASINIFLCCISRECLALVEWTGAMAGNGSIAGMRRYVTVVTSLPDVVMADEDEDPVVAELDVYLSLTLKNKLVLVYDTCR